MYSRPLETPAEEAEIARKLLTERSEEILKRLTLAQQKTLRDRASDVANEPDIVQRRLVTLSGTMTAIEKTDQQQREGLPLTLREELAQIEVFEREGNTQGLTGAQMAREAMKAVEPVEKRGTHVPRRDEPEAEFNLQGERTRRLDPERIKIEAAAALDDPDKRAARQAEIDGPSRKFNEQAQSSALERHKAEQASLIAYVYGTRGPTPDNSQKAELAQEQGSALDRHKAEQAKIIAQSTETKTPDNSIKVEIGRDDKEQDLER